VDTPWSAAAPDPLGEALHHLRLTGTFYCRSELTAPWGLTLPPMPGHLWFHVVTGGGCRLEIDGAPAEELRTGDVALVPHGGGHRLRSAPGTIAPSVMDLPHTFTNDRYALLRHGSGGAPTTLVCGAVEVDTPGARDLVALLPPLMRVSGSPRTDATLALVTAEARELRPGGEAVLTRLADVLVIQVVRSWLETDPAARTGWLGALADPRIGRAVTLIHRDPARAWTVASLAAEVPMSRSAFAARFTALVGEPALAYVTRRRMHLALDRLRGDGAGVAEVAGGLGYRSEAAFSRAFKRVIGTSPGAVRRGALTPR
jgi:AraC-like DNA-binding protein